MAERNRTTTRSITDVLLSVVFVLGIALPFVGKFLKWDTGLRPGENRRRARMPEFAFSRERLEAWPGKFEDYWEDRFGFRKSLVLWHSLIRTHVFGVSTSSDVVVGRDGWLFYANGHVIDDCRGMYPFTEAELRRWQHVLEARHDWLASQGIRFLFVVVPEKSSIYPELLPWHLKAVGEPSRLDQLIAHMREHSHVRVLDVRPGLLGAKKKGPVYRKTDTHWNDVGAFVAYRQIARALSETYEAVQPSELSEFRVFTLVGEGGDLAGLMGLQDGYQEERVHVRHRGKPPAAIPGETEFTPVMRKIAWPRTRGPLVTIVADDRLPTAVVVRDSFMVQIQPFLSDHFRRAVYLWHDFSPEVIVDEKPDIVIYETVERVLLGVPPLNPPVIAAARGER